MMECFLDRLSRSPYRDSFVLKGGVLFSLDGSSAIMDSHDYPGLRVHLTATLDKSRIPVLIDLSARDVRTPREIEFSYPRIFGGSISLLAYPPETLAAEKLETILSRGTANTRMKDFYDVVLLFKRKDFLDSRILEKAILATAAKRRTAWILEDMDSIVKSINDSGTMEKRRAGKGLDPEGTIKARGVDSSLVNEFWRCLLYNTNRSPHHRGLLGPLE